AAAGDPPGAARVARRISEPARLHRGAPHADVAVPPERVGYEGDHDVPAGRHGPVAPPAALDHRSRARDDRRDAAPGALRLGLHQGAGGRRAVRPGRVVALDRRHAARLSPGGEARIRAQGRQALLPLHRGEQVGFFYVTLVSFLNLGLAGFVLAAIAARFIFPAVSLEGRHMWLLRSSPLDLRALLWSKYWVGTLPLLALALLLTGLTNVLLQVRPFMMVVGLVTICGLTFAIAALALGFGALYP